MNLWGKIWSQTYVVTLKNSVNVFVCVDFFNLMSRIKTSEVEGRCGTSFVKLDFNLSHEKCETKRIKIIEIKMFASWIAEIFEASNQLKIK